MSRRVLFLGFLLASLVSASAAPPAWWASRGATDANPPNDDAAVNQGQLKQFTQKAVQELNARIPGGAGADLNSLVNGWGQAYQTGGHNASNPLPAEFEAMNSGQLKWIAKRVHSRLVAVKYENALPAWLVQNSATDNQLVNLGQLKTVFNFDLIAAEGLLPDWWQKYYFNGQTGIDPNGDDDGDGISNGQELALGTDPNAVGADADANGLPDDWEQANTGRIALYPPVLRMSLLAGHYATRALRVRNDTDDAAGYVVSLTGNAAPAYTHVDSQTGSVPYAWEDISSTGNLLSTISSSDDASEPIALPFPLPFYGSLISSLHVSSNGFLSTAERYDQSGPLLPAISAPPNVIAPLWMDLNPAAGGDIFFQSFADHAIIQFQNVARYGNPDETYTFQIALHSNGEIEFRYAGLNGPVEGATIGVQNGNRQQGDSVIPGSTYLISGLAIRFTRPAFFEMNPAAANIPPHSTVILNGIFHSLSLPAGELHAAITLTPEVEENYPLQASAILKVLADTDSDGMPDEWEIQHGFEPSLDDADADPDRDGYTNLEEFENGTDPHNPDNTADSDNDGMWDRWESLHGLNPSINDSANDPDLDGLTNLQEFQRGTHPNLADSDSDGMPDGWEVTHSLNPMLNDSAQDPDGDGLTNLEEFNLNTDPHVPNNLADLDNDGMLDAWETRHGLDPTTDDSALDPDKDGLTNLQEFQLRTNPKDPDTDGDSLPDGWEHQYQLDPKIGSGTNGKSGDPDHDDATNFVEWQYGCDPLSLDTDGDGTNDGPEIINGSDPNDPSDGGNPPPADTLIDVPFRVGDPSVSHSETWTMKIVGKGPDDHRTIKIASPNYGEMAEQSHKLRKNNQYEITLEHLRTDPEYLEDNDGESDYDWEAQIDAKPGIQVLDDLGTHTNGDRYFIVKNHWIVDNKDGLLGTVDQSFDADDYTPGKTAMMMPVDFKLRHDADVVKGWDSTEPEDWTSVGVGKTNSIVQLSILGATSDVGNYYEIKPAPDSEQFVSVPDSEIKGDTTDFDIHGDAATTSATGCSLVVREKANHANTAGILNAHVFTERMVYFQVFHASDDRIVNHLSDVPPNAPTPTYVEIEEELNAVFTPQCNIKFVKRLITPTILNKCYGAFSTDGNFYKDLFTGNIPSYEYITGKLPSGKFLSIVIVKHIMPDKNSIGFSLPTTPYVFVNYDAGVRVVAHETGHALELSTKGEGQANKHDNGPGPGGIEPMLSSPNKGHQSRWMRQKDWKKSNDTANGPLYK